MGTGIGCGINTGISAGYDSDDTMFSRSAGVLLHVSSLPSPYGIGSFGDVAGDWVDFLHDAGQNYWQILPLDPTGTGGSPYQSFSAFAGNPYFIDLDTLFEEGLLERSDYADLCWGRSDKSVDFGMVHKNRECVLRKAFSRFDDDDAIDDFISRNYWFEQYGLFTIIKELQQQRPWMQWEEPLRTRDVRALSKIKEENLDDFRFHAFVQYQFERQWNALRAYAKTKKIEIIGDIPIYVSLDSADVWSNPGMFQLGKDGYPTEVSGCPADGFTREGQLWGNPLYDWDSMEKTGYLWWIQRLQGSFEFCDVLRLDHFRCLESYYAIPYGAESVDGGEWKRGPGKVFIDAIKMALPDARIIAEDIGFLTEEVRDLLEYSGYPGMRLLQYAFDNRDAGGQVPHDYVANTVAYTGTHDSDTVMGWCRSAPWDCVREAMEYAGLKRKKDLPEGMIRLALQSGANLAVIPMQDWLGLGGEARMNTPATVGGSNWRWRLKSDDLSPKLADEMAKMTTLYGRGVR